MTSQDHLAHRCGNCGAWAYRSTLCKACEAGYWLDILDRLTAPGAEQRSGRAQAAASPASGEATHKRYPQGVVDCG